MNELQIPVDACFTAEVIICTKERRGDGTEGNPVRPIVQVLTKEGKLIAEHDPHIVKK